MRCELGGDGWWYEVGMPCTMRLRNWNRGSCADGQAACGNQEGSIRIGILDGGRRGSCHVTRYS